MVLAAVGGLTVACSGSDASSPPAFGGKSIVEVQYGLEPHLDSSVQLQPDVVIVGGGASIVRSVSDDSTVWTIDASAPHADELAVGKVMFLTSNGLGRITSLDRTGNDLAVSLSPVDLTDVVSEGTITVDEPIDPEEFVAQLSPGLLSVETPQLGGATNGLRRPGTQQPTGQPNAAPTADAPTTTAPCVTTTTAATTAGGVSPTSLPTPSLAPDCGGATNTPPGGGGSQPPSNTPPAASEPPATEAPTATTKPVSTPSPPTTSSPPTTEPPTPPPAVPVATSACLADAPKAENPDIVDPLFKQFGLNPGVGAPTSASDTAVPAPAPGSGPQPKPTAGPTVKVEVGAVGVEATKTGNALKVLVRSAAALKLGLEFCFDIENLHIVSNIDIHNGPITNAVFSVEGIRGLVVALAGGAVDGLSDNMKLKAELPFEWTKQAITPNGIPYVLSLKLSFLFETAFSAKNSTLGGFGQYALSGDLGFTYDAANGMKAHRPNFSVVKPMLDSLGGLSVGVNGIVFAVQLKAQVGLGVEAFNAGPYAALTGSVGVTVGSDLGIVKCRGVTLALNVKAGLGFTVSKDLGKALSLLPKVKLVTEYPLLSAKLIDKQGVRPKVPICGG